jgi:hypothetical protein
MTDTRARPSKGPSRDWRRVRLRTLGAITIGVTATISFTSIKHLAEHNGFSWMSWLFPIGIDAVAAVSMDIWMSRSKAWQWACSLATLMVLASLAANAWDHWSSQKSYIAAAMGASMPVALALLLIVFHKHADLPATRPQTKPATDPQPAPPAEPSPTPATTPPPPADTEPTPDSDNLPATNGHAPATNGHRTRISDETLRKAQAILDNANGTTIGRARLARVLGVQPSTARAILQRLNAEPATDNGEPS